MAFNNGFPVTYPQMYYPQPAPMPQQMQQIPQQMPQMPQPVQQPAQQQAPQYPIVQGGFVRVMNENEARMYPVAPGNSVTFIDESQPYCYTKTVDRSQLDRPKFERYRLVKEDDVPAPQNGPVQPVEASMMDLSKYAMAADLEPFRAELDAIKQDIETMRGDLYGIAGKKKVPAKKEASDNE